MAVCLISFFLVTAALVLMVSWPAAKQQTVTQSVGQVKTDDTSQVFSGWSDLGVLSSAKYPAGVIVLLLLPEAHKQRDPATTARAKTIALETPQHNAALPGATHDNPNTQHHHETLSNYTTAQHQPFAYSSNACMHVLPL